MKTYLIDPQTQLNKERRKRYIRRMALWVVTHGISHRACELLYFQTTSYTDLKTKINQTH